MLVPDTTTDNDMDYEKAVNQMPAEMEKANEKMARDQKEMDRLKAETRDILARLRPA
jgi:predicted  nucleic acid-binding Zn-ribbon protein